MSDGNCTTGGAKEVLPKKVFKDFLLEIGTANIWASAMSGSIATGYVLLLGATEFEFGLLASIGSLAGISAPLFSYFVDRYREKKKLTLFVVLPVRLMQFIFAAIPFLMFYKIMPKPLLFYMALVVVMSFLNVFAGQAWFSWMGEIIPEKQRGYYFGRRSFVGGAVSMVFAVLAGMYLDSYSNKYFAFGTLFIFGSFFSLIAYYYFTRLPEAETKKCAKETFSFDAIPKKMAEVYKDKNFMQLVWFNAAWTFGITLIGTYQNMYLIKELKMSYTLINTYLIILSVMSLVTTGFWGKAIDRYGSKPVMIITGNILSVTPILWVFIGYAPWMLGVMYFIAGACWSGFNLGSFNLMMKISPKDKRASYMAFNTIAVALAASTAPAVGGAILSFIGTYKLDIVFMQLNNYQLLFLLGTVGRFLPSLFLRELKETGEGQFEKVVLLVRTGVIEGIGALISYVMIPFYMKPLAAIGFI